MATNISRILIHAKPESVWKTLTDPAFVKEWQYGSELITDWKPGSSIRFRTEWQGKVFEQWGQVLEIQPFNLIEYSLFAPRPDLEDKAENYFVMRYILKEKGGQTILEIIQEDNRPGAKQEPDQGEENPVLQQLKALAENQA